MRFRETTLEDVRRQTGPKFVLGTSSMRFVLWQSRGFTITPRSTKSGGGGTSLRQAVVFSVLDSHFCYVSVGNFQARKGNEEQARAYCRQINREWKEELSAQ